MPFQPEQAFAEMARGDAGAQEFLRAFYLFVHTQDDLFDRDKVLSPEVAMWPSLHLMFTFGQNSFLVKHSGFLLPVILTSFLSWVASEDKKNAPDALDRIVSQVNKSQYMDVFFAVCFLVGGLDHTLAMSRRYREYCFDVEPVKTAPSI